jgi:hypothetical protein
MASLLVQHLRAGFENLMAAAGMGLCRSKCHFKLRKAI